MMIRAAMLELLLQRQGYDAKLTGDPETAVERVRAFRRKADEPGTLYVGRGPAPRLQAGGARCAYLQLTSQPFPNPVVDEPPDSLGVVELEAASEALVRLAEWDASLKEALLQGASLNELVAKGGALLQRPIAYFDRNLITLAMSADYWESRDFQDQAHPESPFGWQMPPDIAVDLVEDVDYLHAAEHHEGFYYESAQHRVFYGVNTFDGDEYLARLVVALGEGEQRLHRGEEQLLDVFHAYLDDLHLRYAGNAQVVSSQNDSLHVLVRTELMGAESHARDEAAAILDSFGWSYDDRFLIAKLVFFEGVHWDTVSLYLCSLLEQTVSGSCAFPEHRQIAWMIDLTRTARPGESHEQLVGRVTESLVAMLRNYACKAGLSSEFNSFAGTRQHFAESVQALEMGQIRDPHYWYYRFEDYAFDYLLARCVDELPAQQTCHPALSALREHDAHYGTDYARTLVCFLRNSQNTTHAAAELFIHRTSFMRRMAQVHEVAGVNLNDPDEVLHLLLSAKLLGM